MVPAVLIGAPVFGGPPSGAPPGTLRPGARAALDELSDIVEHSFPDVEHLGMDHFVRMFDSTSADLVILDVRRRDEFMLSRIERAISIDPDTKSGAPIAALTGSLDGKTVVAYCSIGLRSSRLLARIGHSLKDRGTKQAYNLRGGLFQWRNDGHPLVNAGGPTRRIHPYSAGWRQYLTEDP